MKTAMMIDGQAVHHVHQELAPRGLAAATGVLAEEEGDQDADRHRDQGADARR